MEENKGGCGVDAEFGKEFALRVDCVVKGHTVGVSCEPCGDNAGGFVADGKDAQVAVGVGFLKGAKSGKSGFAGATPRRPKEDDMGAFLEAREGFFGGKGKKCAGIGGGLSDEALSLHGGWFGESKETDCQIEQFPTAQNKDGDILVGWADHHALADLERLGEFVLSERGNDIAYADTCVGSGCIEVYFLDVNRTRRKKAALGVGYGFESNAKPRRQGDVFFFKGEWAECFSRRCVFFAEGGLFASDEVVQSAPIAEVIGMLAVLE